MFVWHKNNFCKTEGKYDCEKAIYLYRGGKKWKTETKLLPKMWLAYQFRLKVMHVAER